LNFRPTNGKAKATQGFNGCGCEREQRTRFEDNQSNKTDMQAAATICVKPSASSGAQTSGEPIQQSRIRLNDEQQAAVEYQDGHVMIVAGPGTGKTRTLTHKIARLIEKGALCERVLALTFTNKAAVEMKSRLRGLLGNTVSTPFVGTFHGLGYQILSGLAGDTPLSVVDDGAQRSLIDDSLKFSGKSKRDSGISVDELLVWIVVAKQRVCGAEATFTEERFQKERTRFNEYYDFYQHLLQINGLVDFEDLIAKSIHLLETHAYIREQFIGRFSHLFIDEYQDINAGQYRLIQLLADEQAKICIIGDPDQSIYGFRGSQADCFDWFKKDHPDVRTIFLNRNYRSTQTILEISSQVIKNNPPWQENGIRQKVYSHLNGDRTVSVGRMATENAEAVAIGKRIETMVGGTGFFSMDSGVTDSRQDHEPLSFADFAVLFRTRKQGKIILLALEKAGIPCQLVDRQSLLNHPGVKEMMAIFKLIHGLGLFDDLQNVGRLLKPSLSKATVASVKSWAYANDLSLNQALVQARRIPIPGMNRAQQRRLYAFIKQIDGLNRRLSGQLVDKTIRRIVDKCGIRQMYASDPLFSAGLGRVLETAAGHQTDAAGFLSAVALSSNTDLFDHRVEKVVLITMHAAKGLEFPVVFVAGCEDGYIPYRGSGKGSDLQEERRLFYVALTRAKKHLFLTRADRRRVNGEMRTRQWSPFVAEIENSYKRIHNWKGKKRNRPAQQQLSLF
jgi:superfamily I DNA/RNA helicase